MALVRKAVEPFPKPALFALADQGYKSTFEQLIACIISIRTRDEVTEPVSRQFFERARTPAEVLKLSVPEIDSMIRLSKYHETKAYEIRDIAQRVVDEFGGELP